LAGFRVKKRKKKGKYYEKKNWGGISFCVFDLAGKVAEIQRKREKENGGIGTYRVKK